MAIGVSATACKHTPVGITTHITGLPDTLIRIVESFGYALIDGLIVNDGFRGFVGPGGIHIHPVIFFRIVGYGIGFVVHALTIFAMPALEGVEVNPGCLTPPSGGCIATTWMIGHQVVVVYRLDGGGERLPYVSLHITLYITTDDPDDIWAVFVAVGEKTSVGLRLLYREFASFYHPTPDTHHTDIDTALFGLTDDVVHVIPITIVGLGQQIPLLIVRGLPIDVYRGYIVQHLHLGHVIASVTCLIQVIRYFLTVQSFRHQPGCLTQPEKGCAVSMLQKTLVVRNL